MTDKQIIIDGVDVAECENLMKGIVPFGCMEDRKTCSCMNNPNCYYKQLVRKEQEYKALEGRLKYILNENKALKDCASDEHIDIVALKNYISTLEFHIDQLKADINKKELIFAGIEVSNRELIKELNQLKASKEQAEQKLEKIAKIANGMHDMWINKTQYTDVYNLAEHLLKCELSRIINEFDEIDEVE